MMADDIEDDATPAGPYAQAAQIYWDAGWRGILPLPPGRKKHPPSGYTGRAGVDPSFPDIYAWTETEGAGNIALRMPHEVVGIDVDDYDGKTGVATLALHEAMHGKLPPTWRSTSRTTRAGGIRFYRVTPGLEWPGELDGGGIEIIQRCHRYAVAWPSRHPEGGTYRWYTPDGNPSITPPSPAQLPELPESWITDLTGNRQASSSTKQDVSHQDAIGWIAKQPGALDKPCPAMQAILDTYRTSDASAHGAMNTAILTTTRYAEGQHPGAVEVVSTIRKEFIAKVTSPTHPHKRSAGEAEAEYKRSLSGAVGICMGDPGPATCDCYGQLTAAIVGGTVPAQEEEVYVGDDYDEADDDTPTEPPADHHDDHHDDEGPELGERYQPGDKFILDAPEVAPAIWGDGDSILWAKGEALIIAGPPGVGKTTLVGQVVRARIGCGGKVLGFPVQATGSKVLYLAMDRPQQIARSLRRQFTPADREVLAERLIVWVGPPPLDAAKNPAVLKAMADLTGADTIIVDSLKDVAVGLTEDEVGAGYNRARQTCLAAGVEVLELHHMVKRGAEGRKPNTLADVYGSMHITSGAGSVIVLWGQGGDLVVEMLHLKQPMNDCGPLQLEHDHDAGKTTIVTGTDLLTVVASFGRDGASARDVAQAMFNKEDVDRNEKKKATRALQKLVDQGHIEAFDGPEYHGQKMRMYRTVEGPREGSRAFSGPEGSQENRGPADDVSPSHEGTAEGPEGPRAEGPRTVRPVGPDVCRQGRGGVETVETYCRDCGQETPLAESMDNGWRCPDCQGSREDWWQR